MNLTRIESGETKPHYIEVSLPSGQILCKIYCDQTVEFNFGIGYGFQIAEIKQILAIQENFILFYDNISE